MKPRLTYQHHVLATVAAVLIVSTALWAWHLHRSTHRLILDGFDRKLLAVAGGAAALVDADAHAAYQRPRRLTALTAGSDGFDLGFDPTRGELVRVDRARGTARALAPEPAGGIRSLATVGSPERGFGLTGDGARLLELDPAGRVIRISALREPLDGLFAAAGGLLGWRGRAVFRVLPDRGECAPSDLVLPESLRAMAANATGEEWYGLSEDGRFLVTLTPAGRLIRRVALEARNGTRPPPGAEPRPPSPPAPLATLAWLGGRLHGGGAELVAIDPATGRTQRIGPVAGFFDPDDPFYRRHRAVFVNLQRSAGLTYLYSQVWQGGAEIRYLLDGTLGRTYSPPGAGDELPPASREPAELVQRAGRPWVSPIQQWEPWGLLKSCFTPLRTSTGQVTAMIGADVDISVIRQKTRWAAFTAILLGAGSLVAAGLLSWRIARALRRPLQELKEAALAIAAGYHAAPVEVGGSREIAALAGHLEQLRRRLGCDEERWRDWRAALRASREQVALAAAMRAQAERLGELTDGEAAGAAGGCRVAETTVWWLGAADADPAAAACTRARRTLLVHTWLTTGTAPAGLPARLLATAPELAGAACWERGRHVLHYRMRRPVTLHLGAARHVLNGAGRLSVAPPAVPAWNVPRAGVPEPASPPEEHRP